MGLPVLILGESGSGKTTALRNFEPGEVGVIGVVGKPLPFRSKLKVYNLNKTAKQKNTDRYKLLRTVIQKSQVNTIVIDDSQYLLSYESFDNTAIKGYDKFTNMAVHFKELIEFCIDDLPDNKTVYFLHHTEVTDQGKTKIKTIGKMLDSQLTVEGLFSIVLLCKAEKDVHKFITQNEGNTTAKSPMEMFDLEIDNDLKYVDTVIREYYGI